MPAQSHGEILRQAVHQRAVNQKQLAQQLGISRSTLYEKYEADKLDLAFVERVGQFIRYDFSAHIPELAPPGASAVVAEPLPTYRTASDSLEACQARLLLLHEQFAEKVRQYDELQEKYNALLAKQKKPRPTA